MDLQKIIRESIRRVLNERITPTVYHFCSLGSLVSICQNNEIVLSTGFGRTSDEGINKKHLFFLSLTRQIDGRQGYSNGCNVRIEFDGELLNQRFKGGAVDYWGKQMGKQAYYDYNSGISVNGKIAPIQSRTENEDRLLSNKPIIDDAIKYIKRIDVLINPNKKEACASIHMIGRTQFEPLLYVYDNKKDFELRKNDGNSELKQSIVNDYESYQMMPVSATKTAYTNRRIDNAIINLLELIYGAEYSTQGGIQAACRDLHNCNMEEFIPLAKRIRLNRSLNDYFANVTSIFDTLREDSKIYRRLCNFLSSYMNKIGAQTLRDIYKYKQNLILASNSKINWDSFDLDKQQTFLTFEPNDREDAPNWMILVIPNPEKTSIWSVLPRMRERFVDDVTNWGGEIPQHNSSSDASFIKYLQHLTKIELPVTQYIKIVNKLQISDETKKELLGGLYGKHFNYRDLKFNDIIYCNFLNQNDESIARKSFAKVTR